MTKAEMKKIETEERRKFINDITELILKIVNKQMKGSMKSLQVSINYKNGNRYIKLKTYGQNLNFLIFKDGNVSMQFNEICHAEYTKELFNYANEKENVKVFTSQLKKMLPWLIDIFADMGVCDFHSYMDLVNRLNDYNEAYIAAKEIFRS